MNEELLSKVSEMLKKLGISEELVKKINEEAKNGSVSVEVEASTDKEEGDTEEKSTECECPKCGEKFDPSKKESTAPAEQKKEEPKKFSVVEEMMKSRM